MRYPKCIMNSWGSLILALLLPLQTHAVTALSGLYTEAVTARRDGRPGEALDLLLTFIEQSPEDARREDALRLLWDTAQDIKEGEKRLALDPAEWRRTVAAARQVVSARRLEAEKMLKNLETLADQVGAGKDILGSLRRTAVNPAEVDRPSLDEWERARAERHLESIRQALKKVVESPNPHAADLQEAKGFYWYYQGDLELAIQAWEETLRLNPRNAPLRQTLSQAKAAWEKQKNMEEAEHEFTLALGDYGVGRYDRAIPHFQKVLVLDPENAQAARYLDLSRKAREEAGRQEKIQALMIEGRSEEQSGRFLEAVQVWVEVLSLDPTNPEARRTLERARKRLAFRAPPEARPAGSPAMGAKPLVVADPVKAQESYSLGLIHYSNGDLKAAQKAFKEAVRRDSALQKAAKALEQVTAELGGK
jgi:tetratricopeptide (TPR) repeat protein